MLVMNTVGSRSFWYCAPPGSQRRICCGSLRAGGALFFGSGGGVFLGCGNARAWQAVAEGSRQGSSLSDVWGSGFDRRRELGVVEVVWIGVLWSKL